MTLQEEFNLLFPQYKKREEGHALLTERTCEVIKQVYEVTKPERMLEIGFNAGHTAFGWLSMFPELTYHSVDICQHSYTETHGKILEKEFGDRFKFGNIDSRKLNGDVIRMLAYDMVFIDGDHSFEGLRHDYEICSKAKVKWILIDDYTLANYIKSFLDHINTSENHPYTMVDVYEYDDHDATSHMALFRRID